MRLRPRPRLRPSPRLRLTLVSLLAGAAAMSGGAASAERVPHPVLAANFADPSVTVRGNGFVGVSTGSLVPHASSARLGAAWRTAGSALVRLPSWASTDGDVWAADIARVDGWWVLYFAAPVHGIGEYGRCIGVARSHSATGGFKPVGDHPLVCPSYVDVPAAEDTVPIEIAGLPRAGVIDPSLVIADGQPTLVYKTDRIPSSIRLLPLSDSGLHAGGTSVELMRHDGVLENPMLIQRSGGWVMLLSQGDFTKCAYRTIWRRSTSILDWSSATSGILLDQKTGLCGPGGADVTPLPHSRRLRVYFHAWTCHRTTTPCGPSIRKDKIRRRAQAIRPMYAANLDWVDGVPVLGGFL